MSAKTKNFFYIQAFAVIFMALAIPTSPTLTDISFAFAGLVGLTTVSYRPLFARCFHYKVPAILLLLSFTFIIGLFYSQAPWHDRLEMLGKYSKILSCFLFMPMFADSRLRRLAFWAFSCSMVLTLVVSYGVFFGFIKSHDEFLAESVFRDYIDQNLLMSIWAYLLLLEFFKGGWLRWLSLIVFLITIHQILFISSSRSGYIVFIFLMLLTAWQQFRWKGMLACLGAFVLLLPVFYHVSSHFKQRLNAVSIDLNQYHQGYVNTSTGLRMTFAKHAFLLFLEQPLLGHGTGSYKNLYQTQFAHLQSSFDPQENHYIDSHNPHNEYLHLGVQFGSWGIVLLLLLFAFSWLESWGLPLYDAHVLQAITLAFALGCLANSWLMDMTPGHLYFYWLAAAYGARFRKS